MILSNTDLEKKRVYCLYRVSTLEQVEKDDIPMQRKRCREYCQQMGTWEIVKEFSEKGISGFKVSAKDRDAILEIQKDALQGKFDILLVFMFDRLGRRDDETPFVVEWFVKNGIEVWSATEGQQRFDTHVDKLLNYIRYWQASGESIKTSIRTKTRIGQLTEEGHYTGGMIPYGYRPINKGRTNKRNKEVYDLEIVPDEAEIVRLIFQKCVFEGYGAQRLCSFLSEQGIRNQRGGNIPTTTINRILKNVLYTGVISNGESKSEPIEELRIVDDDIFRRAQEVLENRRTHHNEIPLNTRGQSLLVGNIYCGHCGGRLTLTTSGRKYVRKDGTVRREVRARYQCHYNKRHPGACDGQSGYGVTKLDAIVDRVIRMQFEHIKNAPAQAIVREQQARDVELATAKLKLAQDNQRNKVREYEALKAEGIKVAQGISKFNVDFLNSLVTETQAALKAAETAVEEAQQSLEHCIASTQSIQAEYSQIVSWAEMYDNCSFEAKKMIVAQFVKGVYVHKDYEIEIEFNVSFEDFKVFTLEQETQKKQKSEASLLQTSA